MSDIDGLHTLISKGNVDFGKQSEDYLIHRPGIPDSFFDRIAAFLPNQSYNGIHALDMGTGPGLAAFKIQSRGAKEVVGIDMAPNQIAQAKLHAEKNGISNIRFEVAAAEKTNQPDNYYDLITAIQCWPWFDHSATMKEIHRILKPGGVFVIGHFNYLTKRSPVAKDTDDIVVRLNPNYTMGYFDGLYPRQVDTLVVDGGFDFIEQFSYDHQQPFTHESWCGRMRTCNGVGSNSLGQSLVPQFNEEVKKMLKEKYPEEPFLVWHRIWAVAVRSPKKSERNKIVHWTWLFRP